MLFSGNATRLVLHNNMPLLGSPMLFNYAKLQLQNRNPKKNDFFNHFFCNWLKKASHIVRISCSTGLEEYFSEKIWQRTIKPIILHRFYSNGSMTHARPISSTE